jgi:hypothetical protein
MSNLVFQFDDVHHLAEFRSACSVRGVVALAIPAAAFWRGRGIDVVHCPFGAAERWGARPIAPGSVAFLETTPEDQLTGFPPRVVVGGILDIGERNSEENVGLLIGAILRASPKSDGNVTTVGFLESSFHFGHKIDWSSFGRAVCQAYRGHV